ncbi:MAG TPA: sporulation protein YqfD, partial [Bacillota bacterium]|nr:sporulation protein YqfD [Bacillota bacterium]
MNLQRLWSWLVGFLVIRINGDSLEKFINMAASRGILIWDIRRLQGNSMLVRVRLSALRPLRHIRRRVGCRVKVVDKRGLPFYFWQMRRRKLLTVGAIMFLLTIYLLSSFVWFIDITGNKQVAKADILKALRSEGIREGVWRHSLDLKGAEKRLTGKVPDLAWAGLEMHGT